MIFFGSVAESVDAPDLKSVGHCARGSSSLPIPILRSYIIDLEFIMLIDCFSYKIFKTNLNFLYREKFINIIENLPCDKVLEGANSTTTNGKF